LGDAADGVGEAVELAEEGHQVEAVQAFGAGIWAAVDRLWPAGSPSESDFLAIVRAVQPEAGAIVGILVSIVEELVDSAVCWRRSAARARAWRGWEGTCDAGAEARGGWCYAPCREGYEAARGHCRQACGGMYPAGGERLLCGKTDAAIAVATMEILAQTATAASTGEGLAELAAQAGLVVANDIPMVLDAFAALAQPFGHPRCPEDANATAMAL